LSLPNWAIVIARSTSNTCALGVASRIVVLTY
jgi:hypothetical protein